MIHEFFHDCLASLEDIGQFFSSHKGFFAILAVYIASLKREIIDATPKVWNFLSTYKGVGGIMYYIKNGEIRQKEIK